MSTFRRAAAAAVVLCGCALAHQAEPEKVDVVIVGGGISGLWTAHQLKKHTNLSVVVLEGRDRVGGRLFSVDPGSADAFDLGGHWVGRTQYHILSVLKELGIETYNQWTTGTKILDIDGKVRHYKSTLPNLPLMQEANFALFALLAEHTIAEVPRDSPWKFAKAPHFDNQTVDSFCSSFPWNKETKQLVSSATQTIMGKELPEISSLQFLHYAACVGGLNPLLDASPGGGQEFKVHGGTQNIVMQLAKTADVRYNSTVVGIDQTAQGAVVQTLEGSRYAARRVVLSIPPHLAARIWFNPPLPSAKAHLLTQMTQGHLIKTFAMYKKAFWRDNGFSGEVVSSRYPLSICYDDTTPGGKAALVCFVGGGYAAKASPLSKEDRQAAVIESLVEYFGEEARNVDQFVEKDWGLEPFTGGCPTGSLAGGALTQWGPVLREPHGVVSFGGTETAIWWYGYMNGGVQAGERCAMETMEGFGISVPDEMRKFYDLGGSNKPPSESQIVV